MTNKQMLELSGGVLFCQIAATCLALPSVIGRLHQMARDAGRDPSSLQVKVFGAPADAASLVRCREAGIQRVLLAIPDLSRDEILRLLDKNAPVVKKIHGT